MSYIVDNWSFDPMVVLGAVAVLLHAIGLRRMAGQGTSPRIGPRRRQALLFYSGVLLVLLALCSPLEHWSYDYFFVHMIQHIVIMFFAPILVVAGAPWRPMLYALPAGFRRRVITVASSGRACGPLRQAWRFVSSPWIALLAFDAVMVVWHLPGPFDFAERTSVVHVWLMYGSYLVAGVLFWLQIIHSAPFRQRGSAVWQIGAIISTNVVMFVLAMALSIFTNHSWYSVYAHRPGVTLSAFADQQIGAAILWICGDFWAVPALTRVVKRAMDQEGSLSQLFDAMVGRPGNGWGHLGPSESTDT